MPNALTPPPFPPTHGPAVTLSVRLHVVAVDRRALTLAGSETPDPRRWIGGGIPASVSHAKDLAAVSFASTDPTSGATFRATYTPDDFVRYMAARPGDPTLRGVRLHTDSGHVVPASVEREKRPDGADVFRVYGSNAFDATGAATRLPDFSFRFNRRDVDDDAASMAGVGIRE